MQENFRSKFSLKVRAGRRETATRSKDQKSCVHRAGAKFLTELQKAAVGISNDKLPVRILCRIDATPLFFDGEE
ncbi:hypothetical protein JYP52_00680 [Nitratireductor aquibiodomus]|nr:hypothetical protein [Nitratireductor aquibiodomus]MBN7759636.1 hypothetical protein [Nitratireductor aquibiodomus]